VNKETIRENLDRIQKLRRNGEPGRAMQELESLSDSARTVPGFHYLQGCLHQDLGQLEDAHLCYSKEVKENRGFFQAYVNKGVLYFNNSKIPEAIACLKLAMLSAPTEPLPYFNLGNLMRYTKRYKEGIVYYKRAVLLDPGYLDAWRNLASLYRNVGDVQNAIIAYKKIIDLDNHCETTPYLLDAITNRSSKESPASYVKDLFNNYASSYETHVTLGLGYQCHNYLAQMLPNDFSAIEKAIDVGCGTGLAVQAFQSLDVDIKRWVGIDVSEKMLAEASDKNIYKELICGDFCEELESNNEKYNLVVAADVCPYFGCLSRVFSSFEKALAPQGIALFSVELCTDEKHDYSVNAHGRFEHNEDYVTTLIKSYSLQVLSFRKEEIRKNADNPVLGGLFMVCRSEDQ
tara:strand:+ start:765 stop:1973 length:1209 start_codon:yes stop_codon:yes gene_type:complete